MTVAEDTASTTATSMTLTGLCPTMGEGWLFFAPKEDHTDHDHAAGEEEGLGATLAEV